MIFARSGMGYVGAWDEGGIEVSVDHLRRRSGELHGEVVVASAASRGHLHRASFNLSSSTSRDRLAKLLLERTSVNVRGHAYPWGTMLEDFCTAVLEAERRGSPIVKVGQLPAGPAEAYLIDPLLPASKATIVYGAGGTGKSYIACLAAVCVATGHPFLGWPVNRGPVLYLDWETDQYEIDKRIKRVAGGMGFAPPEIDYRSCSASLEDMAEQMARLVSERQISLVVVDSIGMASGTAREGGDANESAIRLFTAIRYLGTTVLAIDHITGEDVKSDKAVAKPYGSIYKVNLARSVWELRRGQEDGHLGLFHRKVNSGALRSPVGIYVDHDENLVSFRREDITDDALTVALGNSTRISRALSRGPLSVTELADQTGITEGVIRTTLNRGRGRLFERLDTGSWGLAVTNQDVLRNVSRNNETPVMRLVSGGGVTGAPPKGGEPSRVTQPGAVS